MNKLSDDIQIRVERGGMPATMRVTADSDIPLWIWDEDGIARIPCTRSNAMKYGMGFGIAVSAGGEDNRTTIVTPHVDIASPVTIPFSYTLSHSETPIHLRGLYEGEVVVNGGLGTVYVDLARYPEGALICPAPTNVRVTREFMDEGLYPAAEIRWSGILTEFGEYSGKYHIYMDDRCVGTTLYNDPSFIFDGNVLDYPITGEEHGIWVTAYCMHKGLESGRSNVLTYTFGGEGTKVTATSDIPLYYSDDSNGPQIVPCSSRVVWDQDNQICDGRFPTNECWEGNHVISSLTFPAGCGIVTRNLSEGSMYDSRYTGTATANSYNNTLDINLTRYPDLTPTSIAITASSPIPLYFCAGGDAPALIPHTVSAGILGEASQLLKGTSEEDILEYYHVDRPEEQIIRTTRGGYEITATWNLGKGTVHFELTPVVQLTVDIDASVAAGGIPTTIKTSNDEPFTFIVRNDTTDPAAVAVFLSFRGVGIGAEYPRDITGLVEKPGGGYGPPGSNAYIWDNGYVSPTLLNIAPNTSVPYTLTVWLPDEAIPEGRDYASYTIHTILKKY